MNLQNLSLRSLQLKKPDGGTRLNLNLKELNEFVKYEHFKMDGIKTIINMVTRNCFMVTMDLKDAYFSVAISRLFQKFLRFKQKDKLYCFTYFPNNLGSCPRKLTKLKKVPITTLHFENVPLTGYIDDLFTKGDIFSICEKNIRKAMRLVCTTSQVLPYILKVLNCSDTKNLRLCD